jgi:hypothetical protein
LTDLTQLSSMGLVESNPLVKREIPIKYFPLKPESEWSELGVPEREDASVEATVTVYLRRFRASDSIAIRGAGEDDQAYMAVHRSVFTEDGKRLFPTIDDAFGLKLEMFHPLLQAINKLNGVAIKKKSKSKTSSGATSPSPSADAP